MLVSKRPKFDTFDLIDTLPQSISMWLKTFQKYIKAFLQKFLLAFLGYGTSESIFGILGLRTKVKKKFKLHLLFL